MMTIVPTFLLLLLLLPCGVTAMQLDILDPEPGAQYEPKMPVGLHLTFDDGDSVVADPTTLHEYRTCYSGGLDVVSNPIDGGGPPSTRAVLPSELKWRSKDDSDRITHLAMHLPAQVAIPVEASQLQEVKVLLHRGGVARVTAWVDRGGVAQAMTWVFVWSCPFAAASELSRLLREIDGLGANQTSPTVASNQTFPTVALRRRLLFHLGLAHLQMNEKQKEVSPSSSSPQMLLLAAEHLARAAEQGEIAASYELRRLHEEAAAETEDGEEGEKRDDGGAGVRAVDLRRLAFITISNSGYAKYTLNALESLRRLDPAPFILFPGATAKRRESAGMACKLDVLCLDDGCKHRLASALPECPEQVTSIAQQRQEYGLAASATYNSPSFKKIVRWKFLAIFQRLQSPSFDVVVFTDGDIVFLSGHFLAAAAASLDFVSLGAAGGRRSDSSGYQFDIAAQCDAGHAHSRCEWNQPRYVTGALCSGFLAIRATPETMRLFDPEVVFAKKGEYREEFEDQMYLNSVLAPNLGWNRVTTLDRNLFPNGAFHEDRRGSPEYRPMMIHFNHNMGDEKKETMQREGLWLLNRANDSAHRDQNRDRTSASNSNDRGADDGADDEHNTDHDGNVDDGTDDGLFPCEYSGDPIELLLYLEDPFVQVPMRARSARYHQLRFPLALNEDDSYSSRAVSSLSTPLQDLVEDAHAQFQDACENALDGGVSGGDSISGSSGGGSWGTSQCAGSLRAQFRRAVRRVCRRGRHLAPVAPLEVVGAHDSAIARAASTTFTAVTNSTAAAAAAAATATAATAATAANALPVSSDMLQICRRTELRAPRQEQVEEAMARPNALLRTRVFGVGLPHSGTTTLAHMLRQLGCCHTNHNLEASPPDVRWVWDWTGGGQCEERPTACTAALRREAGHFQCLTDNPWAKHWRELTTQPVIDSRAFVVLTRSVSPAHYATSVEFWARRNQKVYGVDPSYNDSEAVIARYNDHLQQVRSVHRSNPRYFEICFGCGDDLWSIARHMRLNMSAVEHAVAGSKTAMHANSHPEDENPSRLSFLRDHIKDAAPGFSLATS